MVSTRRTRPCDSKVVILVNFKIKSLSLIKNLSLLFVVREMNIEGHTESLSLLQQFCPKEVQKLFWEDPLKDPKRLEAFHVADQLHLAVELISLRILGQLLHVVDGQSNQEVHHHDGDENDEEQDGDVGKTRKVVVVDAVADCVVLDSL